MEVVKPVQLFETSTKHDLVVKGHVLKLKLEPCSCGVNAKWVIELKAIDTIPHFMHHMISEEDKKRTIDKTVEEWHFHPNWFQRYILRHKLEPKLKRWIEESKKKYLHINKLEADVEKLKTII